MPMQFPAFASTGRFPGGPASANFFLTTLGRNGSSARPISPRSRLLQLQQENKKKVSLLKNVLIPSFLPFRRGFFLRNDAGGRKRSRKILFHGAGQTADDKPTAGLSAGESYPFRRIMILKSRLNQHSGRTCSAGEIFKKAAWSMRLEERFLKGTPCRKGACYADRYTRTFERGPVRRRCR
jgi:hypothetical protein